MLDWLDIVFRLGAAALTGSLIGIYLELQQKPTGMRTLGLVALASAVAVLAVAKDPDADASRVIQGVITGVGFLGAGVILHRATGRQVVHGLSTAATIWITASLGVLCGLAAWSIWIVVVVLTAFLLFAGGVIDNWLHGRPLLSVEQLKPQERER
jgi:putative Mg2+ transporter-C (MgtC) family protein